MQMGMSHLASRLAVAAALAFLQGCAASSVQDDWYPQPTHAALPPYHIEIAERDLPRACGDHPGMRLHGCAVRLAAEKVCLIYTAPRPAAWLMEHERKHCAGWDHGPAPDPQGRRAAAVSPLLAAETRHAH
jgi:hypothetical protein